MNEKKSEIFNFLNDKATNMTMKKILPLLKSRFKLDDKEQMKIYHEWREEWVKKK